MTSLLDYVEEKIRESDNPFQSDYRSEVDTLISLAFPSTQKRNKWEHPDYNSMSDEEYYASPHFQGQGRVAESHPVASVAGPLKGANVLRKYLLGQATKLKPTTAPLAITDQTYEAPLAEPLRLEGPPDLPMLTYDGGDEPSPYMDYDELRAEALHEATTGGDPTAFLEMQAAEWEEFDRGGATDPDAAYPAEVNQEYNPDYDGGFPEQEEWDVDDDVEFGVGGDETPDDYVDDPKIVSGPPLSDEEFYTKPKGFTSSLDKIIAGDTLTKAEKESAVREMKYSQMSYDKKMPLDFPIDVDDPYPGWEEDYQALADSPPQSSPIPGINDIEAIKKFKEEKPLEFTVRHSDDTVGGMPGDHATHLYFGGVNTKGAEHFFTNGRPAQAFITYNDKGGSFNIEEAQSEMRGQGNPYMNQVVTKLAQQTVLNWAKTGLNTITIPTGEAIFEKYAPSLHLGKHLWPEEMRLLKLKDDGEFDKKAIEFYNEPIIQKEIMKKLTKEASSWDSDIEAEKGNIRQSNDEGLLWEPDHPNAGWRGNHSEEYIEAVEMATLWDGKGAKPSIQDALDLQTSRKVKLLKSLKGNYQGKVKHYNEYVKQVKKALKQHGANLFDEKSDKKTRLKITNPEETKRKTEIDGFSMAMLLKKTKKRQVA